MATTGLKHQKNPIGKRKEDLVRDPRNKVKEKGHQDVSAPGPDGMEENIFRPKIWTKEKKLSEVKLAYQNLTNKLLKKSGISAEDMSQGMKQLEEMMANIFFLNDQIQEEEECSSLDDGWKESCDLPSGWMTQDKQQDFKKEMVISLDKHSSLEDVWKQSCDLPKGWVRQKKQHPSKEEQVTSTEEKSSPDYGWQGSCDLPKGWVNQEKQQNSKEDQVTSTEDKPSPGVGWQWICNLPRGGMKNEKQQISETDQGTLVEIYTSTEDKWKGSCDLPRE